MRNLFKIQAGKPKAIPQGPYVTQVSPYVRIIKTTIQPLETERERELLVLPSVFCWVVWLKDKLFKS